jgi:hypothetical protein
MFKFSPCCKKVVIVLLLSGLGDLACAQNPENNGVGPYDSNNVWHIQNGNTVTSNMWCTLDIVPYFPGYNILQSHANAPFSCVGNSGVFACEGNEGSFANFGDRLSENAKCFGPERSFDIVNNTGYSIKSIYYDGDDYRTNTNSPSSSIWLVWETAKPGETRSTDFGGSSLAVDTDYGQFKGNGSVGNMTIQSDDVDEKSTYNVAQASVVQNNFNNPDGKYLLTSSVPIHDSNLGPHPATNPIACAIPPTNGQFSTAEGASGKTFLLPSIMEAKLKLCVNVNSSKSNVYYFHNLLGTNHELDITDTKLYPKIGDSTYETNFDSGYTSESLIYSDEVGLKCSQYAFVLKTKSSSCEDLQNNSGSINSAQIAIEGVDSEGNSNNFTLKFNSNVVAGDNNVDAIYQLQLVSNTPQYGTIFKLVGGGPENSLTCAHGICNGEIDYYPPN